eukprot:10462819-Ditylum_brightwellii.AAC.1
MVSREARRGNRAYGRSPSSWRLLRRVGQGWPDSAPDDRCIGVLRRVEQVQVSDRSKGQLCPVSQDAGSAA